LDEADFANPTNQQGVIMELYLIGAYVLLSAATSGVYYHAGKKYGYANGFVDGLKSGHGNALSAMEATIDLRNSL
jgi:hypothetical protein